MSHLFAGGATCFITMFPFVEMGGFNCFGSDLNPIQLSKLNHFFSGNSIGNFQVTLYLCFKRDSCKV